MKKLFLRSIFLSIIGLSFQSIPQVYATEYEEDWIKLVEGNNSESFSDVIELRDDGIVAIGYTNSTNLSIPRYGNIDALLIKYNQDGVQEWITSWGGSGQDNFSSGVATSDGGFVVTGQTKIANKGTFDIVTIKYNTDGEKEWVQTFGGTGWDEPDKIIQTKDGGFTVLGTVDAAGLTVGANQSDYLSCLIKYDSNGTQEWVSYLGEDGFQYGEDFIELEDGSFIIQGYEEVAPDYEDAYAFLWKVDAKGQLIWEKQFGTKNWNTFYKIIKSDDGFVVIGDFTEDAFLNNGNTTDTFLLVAKFSEEGSLI